MHEKKHLKPEFHGTTTLSNPEIQRLWRTYILKDWEDDYEREKAALNDDGILHLLKESKIPDFPPFNWLDETATFVRERWEDIPSSYRLPDGLILETKVIDGGDKVIVEETKLVRKQDGFGGNKVITDTREITFQELADAIAKDNSQT